MVGAVRSVRLFVLTAAVLVGGCGGGDRCASRPAATPIDRTTTATVTGTVSFEGTPPPMRQLSVQGDPQCAAKHEGPVSAGDALVHDGRVENVFVYVKEGLGDRVFAVPDTPVEIDQAGCVYKPHVAGAQVCQPIRFVNSDEMLHNVHGTPTRSRPWNFGMAVQGSKREVRVEVSEVAIEVRCDVHPWMRAYLGVVDHPYFAVTGPDGRFTLAGLPPGEYVVGAWHERFGTREQRVTVGARETKDVSFSYTGGS
jgi:plastocyanin